MPGPISYIYGHNRLTSMTEGKETKLPTPYTKITIHITYDFTSPISVHEMNLLFTIFFVKVHQFGRKNLSFKQPKNNPN